MRGDVDSLTERERETLRLLLSGHDAKSLARHFDLSIHTINDRLRDARRKLGVSSSREAARLLVQSESGAPDFLAGNEFGVAARHLQAEGMGLSRLRLGEAGKFVWFAGGMITVSLIIIATVLSSTMTGHTTASPPFAQQAAAPLTAAEADGVNAAKAWAELLDAQNWAQSWRAAGAIFQARMPETQWIPKITALRRAMGRMASRRVKDVQATTSLPGAPDGQYEIVQFNTDFAQKSGAIETVVLAREASGWKVDGYFVR